MSDERVQQVIDELDPTPAHEVAWPVSRRQTLRALAAAGLLGAGAGSGSAQSAGGVIADEAVLSNYGSESVSDGWELTIDDDVFGLTASEDTIDLPDGAVGEELVTPSGGEATEIVAPDGTVVFDFSVDIPDSAIAQYNAKELDLNDQDTVLTWTDAAGSLDATGGDASYITDGINGNPSVRFDGDLYTTDIQTFSQRLVVIMVLDLNDNASIQRIFNDADESTDDVVIDAQFSDNRHLLFAGNDLDDTQTPPTSPYLLTVDFNGSNSAIRINGTEVASGGAGTNDFEGIAFGARNDGTRTVDGDIGIIEPHNGPPSNGLSTREQEIAYMFGIDI